MGKWREKSKATQRKCIKLVLNWISRSLHDETTDSFVKMKIRRQKPHSLFHSFLLQPLLHSLQLLIDHRSAEQQQWRLYRSPLLPVIKLISSLTASFSRPSRVGRLVLDISRSGWLVIRYLLEGSFLSVMLLAIRSSRKWTTSTLPQKVSRLCVISICCFLVSCFSSYWKVFVLLAYRIRA